MWVVRDFNKILEGNRIKVDDYSKLNILFQINIQLQRYKWNFYKYINLQSKQLYKLIMMLKVQFLETRMHWTNLNLCTKLIKYYQAKYPNKFFIFPIRCDIQKNPFKYKNNKVKYKQKEEALISNIFWMRPSLVIEYL